MNSNSDKEKISLIKIKKILSLLLPFKFRIIIVCICALISSVLTTIQPLLRQYLIDEGILIKNLRGVVIASLLLFGLFALNQLLRTIQFIHYTYINKILPFKLFQRAFRHLLKLPVSFYKDF